MRRSDQRDARGEEGEAAAPLAQARDSLEMRLAMPPLAAPRRPSHFTQALTTAMLTPMAGQPSTPTLRSRLRMCELHAEYQATMPNLSRAVHLDAHHLHLRRCKEMLRGKRTAKKIRQDKIE